MIQVNPFKERVQSLLVRVSYKVGTGFYVSSEAPTPWGLLLQHYQTVHHSWTGAVSQEYGRKWYLSPHMLDEEILQTALMAVLAFEEHETREAFQFDGVRLFSPHKSLLSLCAVVEVSRGNVREA